MGTKLYLFQGSSYARYDRADDRADDGYPRPIAGAWPGMAEVGFGEGVDAALNNERGKLYFFRGDRYVRYDVAADRVDDGYPLPIAGSWPGLAEAGFGDGVDAAVLWPGGKAFFFRRHQYVRYDMAADKVDDGYPLPIAGSWPGFAEAGFGGGIDAITLWGDGTAYAFSGDRYLAYDVATDRTRDGYPRPVADGWPGLAAIGFATRVKAPVDLWTGAELWLDGVEQERSPKNGPRFLELPWRGVLHTTEGGGIGGALQTFRATNFWPHLTIEPATGRIVQHLPLTIGSRALSDKVTPWPNASRCIQIEIVGFAAQSPSWAPEHLAFVRDVLRRIEDLVPIPRRSGRSFLNAAGVNATPSNRMSVDEWKRFSGWCGHQHVPGESHWDPGGLDIEAVLAG